MGDLRGWDEVKCTERRKDVRRNEELYDGKEESKGVR